MFKCQIGNHVAKPNTRRIKVITRVRNREYPKDDNDKSPRFNPHGPTFGTEIVQELNACEICAIKVIKPEIVTEKPSDGFINLLKVA